MYASIYFNKVSFNLPSPLNSMVTMLLSETVLQGVSHWLQNRSWLQNLVFSFPTDDFQEGKGISETC